MDEEMINSSEENVWLRQERKNIYNRQSRRKLARDDSETNTNTM